MPFPVSRFPFPASLLPSHVSSFKFHLSRSHPTHRKLTHQKSVLLGIGLNIEILLLCITHFIMKLMMFIGNDLIESIPLNRDQIQRPGYIGSIKRMLKVKYNQLIQQFQEPVEFLVQPVHAESSSQTPQKEGHLKSM